LNRLSVAFVSLCPLLALAQKADITGSKDHPLISRYPGLVITIYNQKDFDNFLLPLGKLIPSKTFVKSQQVEGKVTRIYYEYPEDRSTLEIFRNYETALKKSGFVVLFTCDSEDTCGFGDVHLTADRAERWWSQPRQLTAKLSRPTGDVYVSLHVYGNLHGIQLDVIESKPMEGGLVTVDAAALGNDIAQNGHTPVYGIFFDTGKTDVKAESDPALSEIAKLLQQDPKLQLYVVGHTDTVGSLKSNMDLSQRRAEATLKVLTGKFGVSPSRLQAWGDGPTSPVATNQNRGRPCEEPACGIGGAVRRARRLACHDEHG
jgi:outer membrane protein OmpA-like peptidoglycan-associated protein